MSELVGEDQFLEILLNHRAIIDVRAPCEFELGAIPNSVNLPILSDSDRWFRRISRN